MLNSGFIPEVVDAGVINSQINSMQSSVNNINNSFSTINSRLTQLEKDISSDVLKATESLGEYHFNDIPMPSYVEVPLSRDLTSYSYINLRVAAFTVTGYKNIDKIDIPSQQVKITKKGTGSITVGVRYHNSETNYRVCIGDMTQSYNYGISSLQQQIYYYNNKLRFTMIHRILVIAANIINIEYY